MIAGDVEGIRGSRVYPIPRLFIVNPEKFATPRTAVNDTLPLNVALLGFPARARFTFPLNVGTTLPYWSTAKTFKPKEEFTKAFMLGDVTMSWVAAAGDTFKAFDVAVANTPLAAINS